MKRLSGKALSLNDLGNEVLRIMKMSLDDLDNNDITVMKRTITRKDTVIGRS